MFEEAPIVVVSPHPDDAVYSLSGLLGGNNNVRVLTVCSGLPDPGTPPANYDLLTKSKDPHERMKTRRQEDREACESLGWTVEHLDHLDAPYLKSGHDTKSMEDDIFQFLKTGPLSLWFPAAIGSHSDHIAVRDVVLAMLPKIQNVAAFAYADYPYAAYYGWGHRVAAMEPDFLSIEAYYDRSLAKIKEYGVCSPSVVALSESQVGAKLAAMKMYRTQFDAMEMGPSKVLTHPERIAYEMYWTVTVD